MYIGADLKRELSEWCRLRRTTAAMSLFAAYVGLVLRWCDAPEAVFQYQINGRSSPQIEETIGYFASILFLRVPLLEGDKFIDLVRRVTEEYCEAYEHADFSSITAQRPLPEFARNGRFNWIPLGSLDLDLSRLQGSADELTCAPVRFTYPAPSDFELDREPFMLLADTQQDIVADVYFPLDRFSSTSMQLFLENFRLFIELMVRQPTLKVKTISLQR